MLDFPLSVLLQVLKAFAIEYLVIQQINSDRNSYMKFFKFLQVENDQFNKSTAF